MSSLGRRALLYQFARILLVFSPAVLCGYYVAANAVNVPVADDWARAEILGKQLSGDLTLADVNAADAGDRPMVPRWLMISANRLSGGDLRVEIALSFVAFCTTAACLYLLVCKTLATTTSRVVTGLAINLALFSPVQYENLLWAARLGAVLPMACLAIAIVGVCSQLPTASKVALCAVAAAVASFSSAAGLAVWPAVFFAAWCGAGGLEGKRRMIFLISIGLLFMVTLGVYLPGSELNFGGSMPVLLANLGSPLARFFSTDARESAPVLGRILLVLYAACLAYLGWCWGNRPTRTTLGPWAALGGFAIASATLLAFGHGITDPALAVQPRHISAVALLPISLFGIGAYLLTQWARDGHESRISLVGRIGTCAAFGGVAIAISWPGWVHGSRKMEQWKSARLQARGALLYWDHHTPEHPDRLDPDPARIGAAMPLLRTQGWLDPAPLDNFDFGEFKLDRKRMAPSDYEHAQIREASFDDGRLRARGHAALPGSLRAADAVLITWRRDKDDPWKVIAMAEPRGQSVGEKVFSDHTYGMGSLARPKQFSKWGLEKPWADAPQGRFEFGAWMLDAEKMRAYPLDGSLRLGKKRKEGES